MKAKYVYTLVLIVTLLFVTSGCSKGGDDIEVAIAVALTQTAAALEQQPSPEASPTPTPSSNAPESTATPTPEAPQKLSTPTPTISFDDCVSASEFVTDVTIPDYTTLKPAQTFTKTWLVSNTGTCPWDQSYRLKLVEGDLLGAAKVITLPDTVAPEEEYEISVAMTAPETGGTYKGKWQMHDRDGEAFGKKFIVAVVIPGAPTPTPIIDMVYDVDHTHINKGECVEFTWAVDNVQAIYFYEQGANWEFSGVAGHEKRKVCPKETTTYELRVLTREGETEVQSITITLSEPTMPPDGILFTADRTRIASGECVEFFWKVENIQAVYFYEEGGNWETSGVGGTDRRKICPSRTTTYELRVLQKDGSTTTKQIEIQVQ